MIEELNCSYTEIQLGNTAYLLSCAFAPMVLAPLSEQFGRYGRAYLPVVVSPVTHFYA